MGNATRETRRAVVTGLMVLSVLGIGFAAGNKATAAEPSQNIADYVPTKLDDFSATMRVEHYDERAGEKIHKDFGYIYKLRGDIKVQYKEENKIRMDAMIGTNNLTLIVNDCTQYVKGLGYHTKNDLGHNPGKKKTLLDAGFISNGYLATADGEFKRMQEVKGILCAVFRVSYKDKTTDTSHRLVWIDPKTKIVIKREEYSQQGKLNGTFWYLEPKEVAPGIWFPTKFEAYNRDNQQAGVTSYKNVRVNTGLEEGVFKI